MAKKIIFRIGRDLKKDIRAVFTNPKLAHSRATIIYLRDWKDLLDTLSPQKTHLLQCLMNYLEQPVDVNTLAKKVKRRQNAVSRDLNALEKSGLITKVRKGKNVFPIANAKEIVIQFA